MIGVDFPLINAAIFPALEFGSWMPNSVSVVVHLKRKTKEHKGNTKQHDQMADLARVPSACISTAERVSMIFWRPNYLLTLRRGCHWSCSQHYAQINRKPEDIILPGDQILRFCAPGSTNKRYLCSREHKQAEFALRREHAIFVLLGAHTRDICAPGNILHKVEVEALMLRSMISTAQYHVHQVCCCV